MTGGALTPSVSTVVVIPCYEEASRLRVEDFLRALEWAPWLRLVMVDDGSRDDTRRVLEDLAERGGGRVSVRALPANVGKAEAVRHGLLEAFAMEPTYAGYWDADLATPLDELLAFRALLDARPELDLVMASRVSMLGRQIQRRAARHYIGRAFATGASFALGLRVYDTQCGAKLLRVNERARDVFARPFRSRWIFDVEMIARYLDMFDRDGEETAAATRLYEQPLVAWRDAPRPKVRARDGIRAALDLWRIYRSRRRAGRRAAGALRRR